MRLIAKLIPILIIIIDIIHTVLAIGEIFLCLLLQSRFDFPITISDQANRISLQAPSIYTSSC